MSAASSDAPPPPGDQRDELSGRLAIEGGRKEGVYGAFWNVIITPEDHLPVEGTLSEKVWSRLGIPSPDATTSVQVTARRNANGRWNVTRVDAGPSELKNILATLVQLERASGNAAPGTNGTADKVTSKTGRITSYRFRLHPHGSRPFEARIASRALERFGIASLPLNHDLTGDWTREPWGWKLDRIGDAALLAFFEARAGASPTATGHVTADWRFDDGVRNLDVEFSTDVAGISLRCRLYAHTLRNAGVSSLPASDPVRATLSLRDGRWRLAELLEPRPDLAARSKEEIIYAIKTRLVFREENDFGQLVNWLEILDDCAGLGVTSLMHAKLIDIDEALLAPGAHIVCDLRKGKSGWHATRIHRVSD